MFTGMKSRNHGINLQILCGIPAGDITGGELVPGATPSASGVPNGSLVPEKPGETLNGSLLSFMCLFVLYKLGFRI